MDVRVVSIEIAQRVLNSIRARFEKAELMPTWGLLRQADRQTELERHIEPWNPKRTTRQLDTRQIVKRIRARRYQPEQTV